MQTLPEFDVARPASAAEAVALLARPGARAVAGGTDLLPNLRRGLEQPKLLVDLSDIAGFDGIEERAGALAIGAGITLERLASDARVACTLPALCEAARAVGGPGHRSAATLGGNLCQDTRCVYYNQSAWWREANGFCLKRAPRSEPMARPAPQGGSSSPAEPDLLERGGAICHVAPQGTRCHAAFSGDLAPVLLAADAEVEIAAPGGTRRLPLAQLYRDDGAAHLALAPGALLVRVHLRAVAGQRSGYRKARVRAGMDFPLAGVAVVLALRDGALAALGIGISGTNSMPFKLDGTDAWVGRVVDDGLLAALGKQVAKQVSPMRSTVTASNHRRQVAVVLAQRLLRELAEGTR
jgi:4-hydroxybenzoyl-CoA reductase subunit beta